MLQLFYCNYERTMICIYNIPSTFNITLLLFFAATFYSNFFYCRGAERTRQSRFYRHDKVTMYQGIRNQHLQVAIRLVVHFRKFWPCYSQPILGTVLFSPLFDLFSKRHRLFFFTSLWPVCDLLTLLFSKTNRIFVALLWWFLTKRFRAVVRCCLLLFKSLNWHTLIARATLLLQNGSGDVWKREREDCW